MTNTIQCHLRLPPMLNKWLLIKVSHSSRGTTSRAKRQDVILQILYRAMSREPDLKEKPK